MTSIEDRLAELETKLGTRQREAEEALRVASEPPRAPKGASLSKEAEYRQEKARRERRARHEAWAAEYEQQLERVAPEVEQLRAALTEMTGKRAAEERRYQTAAAKLDVEIREVQQKIAQLTSPPPMPEEPVSEGAVEMIRLRGRDYGHVQWVPREIVDRR